MPRDQVGMSITGPFGVEDIAKAAEVIRSVDPDQVRFMGFFSPEEQQFYLITAPRYRWELDSSEQHDFDSLKSRHLSPSSSWVPFDIYRQRNEDEYTIGYRDGDPNFKPWMEMLRGKIEGNHELYIQNKELVVQQQETAAYAKTSWGRYHAELESTPPTPSPKFMKPRGQIWYDPMNGSKKFTGFTLSLLIQHSKDSTSILGIEHSSKVIKKLQELADKKGNQEVKWSDVEEILKKSSNKRRQALFTDSSKTANETKTDEVIVKMRNALKP